MDKTLHITNGDNAADLIRSAGIEGEVLPWRDVLHEGPVPKGLDLRSLSRLRGDFIADRGWASRGEARRAFEQRDRVLDGWSEYRKIRLWFEHDLYDQLQLLQVLNGFLLEQGALERLSLICTDNYLGHLKPGQLAALEAFERPVTDRQLELASTAWAAFRDPDPRTWLSLLDLETSSLPYLEGAVRRMVGEYPAARSGLGVTEDRILTHLGEGPLTMGRLFALNQQSETRVFLGDWSYQQLLREMMQGDFALICSEVDSDEIRPDTLLRLTTVGRAIGRGSEAPPGLHWSLRWFGGVCMTPTRHWRKDDHGDLLPWSCDYRGARGPIGIRLYTPSDLVSLRQCLQAAYAQYIPRFGAPPMPMLDDCTDLPGTREVHVATDNSERVLGLVILKPLARSLLLENIAVHPVASGSGLGGRLMALAESRARALNLDAIELFTHRDLTEARAIYAHRGYSECGRAEESDAARIRLRKDLGK